MMVYVVFACFWTRLHDIGNAGCFFFSFDGYGFPLFFAFSFLFFFFGCGLLLLCWFHDMGVYVGLQCVLLTIICCFLREKSLFLKGYIVLAPA
jgi:hypothetical protein